MARSLRYERGYGIVQSHAGGVVLVSSDDVDHVCAVGVGVGDCESFRELNRPRACRQQSFEQPAFAKGGGCETA